MMNPETVSMLFRDFVCYNRPAIKINVFLNALPQHLLLYHNIQTDLESAAHGTNPAVAADRYDLFSQANRMMIQVLSVPHIYVCNRSVLVHKNIFQDIHLLFAVCLIISQNAKKAQLLLSFFDRLNHPFNGWF